MAASGRAVSVSVTATKSCSWPANSREPSRSPMRPLSAVSRRYTGAGTRSARTLPATPTSTSQLPFLWAASEKEYGSGEPL
jgi:hypothetical protein